MDSSSRLAAALETTASMSEAIDPLFRTIGGGASLGIAVMCAWEALREEPRWDRAAGMGATGGAVFGSLALLHDIVSSW